MEIFTHAIVKIERKNEGVTICSRYTVRDNFKKIVGYKYKIIPIFETVEQAICDKDTMSFICKAEDFKNEKFFVEHKMIWRKPRCILHLSDKSEMEIYFETREEMNKYADDLLSTTQHIKI